MQHESIGKEESPDAPYKYHFSEESQTLLRTSHLPCHRLYWNVHWQRKTTKYICVP